jgi:hypothetical protein
MFLESGEMNTKIQLSSEWIYVFYRDLDALSAEKHAF